MGEVKIECYNKLMKPIIRIKGHTAESMKFLIGEKSPVNLKYY